MLANTQWSVSDQVQQEDSNSVITLWTVELDGRGSDHKRSINPHNIKGIYC